MFGFQTLACLHDIPVIRSSTNKLQDVYVKAKNTSALIRLPCNLAETVADKSLKVALTVANPLVKPLREPVRLIDDYTAEKIRQIEAKYPVITTPTENVIHTLNEKTEPVRHVVNSVKDSTVSTIQQGKDTVSHVANATVNKATDVADSVYTFCETHVPGKTTPVHRRDFGRRTTLLWDRLKSTVYARTEYLYQSIEFLLTWYRMLIISFLLKMKQTNDAVLNRMSKTPILSVLPQRFLIYTGAILECFMARIRPEEDRPELRPAPRVVQQKQYVSRPTLKPGALLTARQSVVVTKQDTTITRSGTSKATVDKEQLYPRLPVESTEPSNDIERLHAKLHPTDVELLYSRLPTDILPMTTDSQEPLTEDQRLLHAKYIATELERQGYMEEDEENEYHS